ncbi:hypothetical protein MGSAQ_002736, partial [marine sediment metagenome]
HLNESPINKNVAVNNLLYSHINNK